MIEFRGRLKDIAIDWKTGGYNVTFTTDNKTIPAAIAPLRPDLHPNGVFAGKDAKDVDTALKRLSQQYYETHYGTREQFISEFGRNYLEQDYFIGSIDKRP